MKAILDITQQNRKDQSVGIYSICTAHPLALEAALLQGKKDGTPVLIESTANQVNQFGGYTGMRAKDFVPFVNAIAEKVGFDTNNIILGGDHLGPVCWTKEGSEVAMAKSEVLIAEYVAAGFKKIHLDTSMACSDDELPLQDELIAKRAARLCQVAEQTAKERFGNSDLVYVVGTEVPVPGGETDEIDSLQITEKSNALATVNIHQQAFETLGLTEAWSRVIGVVVQPGVEFDHTSVIDYVSAEAQELSSLIKEVPNIVFEAHSTDYQTQQAYKDLVKDHFAILKVGPQLTYALREALFALSHIEDEMFSTDERSNLREVCDQFMVENRQYWSSYYPNDGIKSKQYRRYSYSDRIRYYWAQPEIKETVDVMFKNLAKQEIPLPLLQQFMPSQYQDIRNGLLSKPSASELVINHIMQVTEPYAQACFKQEI